MQPAVIQTGTAFAMITVVIEGDIRSMGERITVWI
jgi:hypothetical protein